MSLKSLVESTIQDHVESKKILLEKWSKYTGSVNKNREKKGLGPLSLYETIQLAQVLENTLQFTAGQSKQKLFETTYTDNISFLGIQLPVISAMLPSLCLNELMVVQSLDRRQGAFFYLDVEYGQAKGSITADSVMMSAKTGHNRTLAGRRYATQLVENEAIGTAGSTSYSGTLAYKPVSAGSLVITDGVETFTDDGNGNLVSDQSAGNTGSITYTSGAFSVVFQSSTSTAPLADYKYDYERATNGVPSVNIRVANEAVTALDFPLRCDYSLASAIDLEKAHGLSLESELVKFLGGEIKFSIDHYGIDLIANAAESVNAATPIGSWSGAPVSGQEWLWKKYEFIDQIEKGNQYIIQKTLRAQASFIIAGNTVARVIKQLGADHFKPVAGLSAKVPTGPMVIGELDGKVVVQDPMQLDPAKYYLGFKGDNPLIAGAAYLPYIPLFNTPTLATGDLKAQKGFLSSAGFKIINAGMYTYGSVTGLL